MLEQSPSDDWWMTLFFTQDAGSLTVGSTSTSAAAWGRRWEPDSENSYIFLFSYEVVNRHDIFMSSCWAHSRRQGGVATLGDNETRRELQGGVATAPAQCGVCGWGVARGGDFRSLVTPCCGARHHRDCLQVRIVLPFKKPFLYWKAQNEASLSPYQSTKDDYMNSDILTPERVRVRINGSCESFKYTSASERHGVILVIFHKDEINIFVF